MYVDEFAPGIFTLFFLHWYVNPTPVFAFKETEPGGVQKTVGPPAEMAACGADTGLSSMAMQPAGAAV